MGMGIKRSHLSKFKRDNNLSYKPSQIIVSTGAKQSIANVAQVLLNPGDEVLLPAPILGKLLCDCNFM